MVKLNKHIFNSPLVYKYPANADSRRIDDKKKSILTKVRKNISNKNSNNVHSYLNNSVDNID